ncbi:MAG: hypothetical protein QXZ63_08150, partial [Sulfolobales archaeon]
IYHLNKPGGTMQQKLELERLGRPQVKLHTAHAYPRDNPNYNLQYVVINLSSLGVIKVSRRNSV